MSVDREEELTKEIAGLREQVEFLVGELAKKDRIIEGLAQRLFGRSSEKFQDPNQSILDFGGIDLSGKPDPQSGEEPSEQGQDEDEKRGKKKRKPRRKKADIFPEGLMIRVIETIVPPEVEANPDAYREIGEDFHDELECVAAQLFISRKVTKKFVPVADRAAPPIQSPAPAPSVPGTKAGPRFMAELLCNKYIDHLPQYRQSGILKRRAGIELSRSTLNAWTMAAASYLAVIGEAILQELRKAGVLHVDETEMRYLSPGNGQTKRGYLWVYYAPASGTHYYDWQTGRSASCLTDVLGEAPAVRLIACDGYSAYEAFAARYEIILGSCMAHIRRPFWDAFRGGHPDALWYLEAIGEVYGVDNELRGLDRPVECLPLLRMARAGPIFEKIEKRLIKDRRDHLPKSAMGEAIGYALGQWPGMRQYLYFGEMMIDNNTVENDVRPMKLGLKNYLFFGSADAGRHSALIYTLVANAKEHGLVPEDYFEEVFRRLPENGTLEEAAALTPAAIAAERAGTNVEPDSSHRDAA